MSSRPQDSSAPDGASGPGDAPGHPAAPPAPAGQGTGGAAPPPSAATSLEPLAVDDTDQLLRLAERVGELHERIATRTEADVNGLFELMGSKRRLLFVNFMAGLARGAGFFLGVTLIGGLIIAGMGFFVDSAMAALGQDNVTFRSLLRTVAQEAIAAKQMWEDVNQEVTATDPGAASDAADGTQSPPAPREDG